MELEIGEWEGYWVDLKVGRVCLVGCVRLIAVGSDLTVVCMIFYSMIWLSIILKP